MESSIPTPLAPLIAAASTHRGRDGRTRYVLSEGVELRGQPGGDGRLSSPWRGIAPRPSPGLVAAWRWHDGLGRPGDERAPVIAPCLHSAADARPLTTEVRFGEHDILFAPGDWLWVATVGRWAWCIDGRGSAAAFDRHHHTMEPASDERALWRALADAWAALVHR